MRTVQSGYQPGLMTQALDYYIGSVLPQMMMDNYAQRGTQKILDKAQAEQTLSNMDKANGSLQQWLDSKKLYATDPTGAAQSGSQARANLATLGYSGLGPDMSDEQVQQMITDLAAQRNGISDYLTNNNGTIAAGTWKPAPVWVRNNRQGGR